MIRLNASDYGRQDGATSLLCHPAIDLSPGPIPVTRIAQVPMQEAIAVDRDLTRCKSTALQRHYVSPLVAY
jgi:hypothetical protein